MRTIILVLFVVAAVSGCKKKDNDSYDFTYQYTPRAMPSYPFKFTCDHPAGTVTWDFGDGGTESSSPTTHVYAAVGTYIVSMVVNGDAAHAVKKTLNIGWLMPPAIAWAGVPLPDSPMAFQINVSPDSTLIWDFGDGVTSSEYTPHHAYKTDGSYTVRLTINGHTSVTAVVAIAKDPVYTSLMCNTRIWHDTSVTEQLAYPKVNTPHPDVSFALTYVNPIQIAYNGQDMFYVPDYSTDSVLFFNKSYKDNISGGYSRIYAQYFRYQNIIRMGKDWGGNSHTFSETWTTL